ncbi:kelch-like protein 21 [Aplysia californica]|uniref:Kelch-like protein 21 n=1 Tax=Aplysia californica TaxID=6500 RepID=A0ABM0JU54_APLCA|nr:kelch-like protein 21 [Aplysia californica]
MAAQADSQPDVGSHLLHDNLYGSNMLMKLNEFRLGSLFTDAVLCVGQEEFPCHKNVLAVSSPYFQAMFTSDLKESRENKISFNDISPWTLKLVIDYAYSGKIEITANNAQEMLAAACLFQYPAIVSACETFLEQQLHPSNCLGIEMFAHLHSCTGLVEKAHQFALENFTVVVENDEFLDLPLDRLQGYISSDLIDVRTEESVFHAAMRWIKFDLDAREVHLSELLENVRLAVLDLSNLKLIENNPLVCASEKCLTLVQEAQQLKQSFHETQGGKRRRSMQDSIVQPRPSTVAKEMMVVLGGLPYNSSLSCSVEMYDPHKEKWFNLADLPLRVTWCSIAVLNNSIYVAGGIHEGHIISKVWKFDAMERSWHSMSPMLKPRARHTAAIIDDKMYVLGGVRYERKMLSVETIECYNPVTNKWSAAGRTMFPRKESCVVPYNNTIVEVGGLQGEEAIVKTMDSYHIVGDTIRPSGEQFVLPENIRYAQIVVINAVFYIIWEDSCKMIALNAQKRTYKFLPSLRHSRIHSGASVVNGKIYVTGGLIDSKPTDLVECFDPVTEEWTEVTPMSEGRAYHGCVTLKMC